jgi:hypothetical protein
MSKAQLRAELTRTKAAQRVELQGLSSYNTRAIRAIRERQVRELENQKTSNRTNISAMKARHKIVVENIKAQIRNAKK